MDYARLPRILGAIFYDTLIVFALVFVAAQWFPLVPEHLQSQFSIKLFKQFYVLAICFTYFAYSWRRGGQTIGMKAWRLKLVPSDRSNKPPAWGQCVIRYLVAIISWLALGLGYLWVAFTKQRLSWHDHASKTHLITLPKQNNKP